MISSNLHLHHFVSSLPVRRDVAHRKHTPKLSSLKRWRCQNSDGNDMNVLFGRMAFLVSDGSREYTQWTVLRQEAQQMQLKGTPSSHESMRSECHFGYRGGICLARRDNRTIVRWSVRCVPSQQQSHVSVGWTFSESCSSGQHTRWTQTHPKTPLRLINTRPVGDIGQAERTKRWYNVRHETILQTLNSAIRCEI